MKKHLQSNKVFLIKRRRRVDRRKWETINVRPVNGEDCFNDVGLSHGIVHWADPNTGEVVGHCGVDYFDEHAIETEW